MCSKNVSIDVPINVPVVTSQAAGIIVRTVVEFLSYYTRQIPFPFDSFKIMMKKIQGKELSADENLADMQMERLHRLAIETFDNFKIILENVANQLDHQEFHQALILFGSTSLTPKEAYLINILPVTKNHHSVNHQDSIRNVAKNVLMALVTSQDLFEIESKVNTTNMFVLLHPKVVPLNDNSFKLNEGFRLPRSCKLVTLNLMNLSEPIRRNCCEDLVVYNDMLADYNNLNIKNENVDSIQQRNDEGLDININDAIWYESSTFVRGFKDVLVKGRSIWNV